MEMPGLLDDLSILVCAQKSILGVPSSLRYRFISSRYFA